MYELNVSAPPNILVFKANHHTFAREVSVGENLANDLITKSPKRWLLLPPWEETVRRYRL